MADFFFFTDPEVMATQEASGAFGVIDKNNYKIDSMHSASGTAKAYAVTAGQILVQNVKDNSELVNIVLKPTEQPNLNLPVIEYIIYKGVLKSSLVEGTKVAPATTNGFTQQIYAELTQNYANKEEPIPDTLPLAGDVLGLDYAANATVETYKVSDEDALSKAFYNSDLDQTTLRSVKAGTHIGTFSNAKFGVLVSFEKVGYEPTFKLARELDSNIEVDETTDSLSIAEKFKIKHEKEEVHNFIDPAAFFGAFSHLGLNSNGIKTGDTLYNNVVTKFTNKNKIYVDLRNEYDDSYNYYENYGNFVYWYAGDQEAFEQKNYYGENEWPVLVIDEAELPADKTLKLGFPKGDNDYPLIFLKRGFLETLGVEELPEDDECYLGGATDDNGIVSFSNKLKIPTTGSGNAFSNYFQLKYIKRYTTSESEYLGYSLKKESYLDNLFPIFDMQIPFTNPEGTIAIKTFDESAYVDKSNINEDDFFVKTGIAVDQEAVNFIAYPQHYSNDDIQTTEILPLAGKESFEGISFLDDFDKHFSNFGIKKQNFATTDANLEYLTLDGGSGLASVVEGQLVVEEAISSPKPSIGKVYDYDNINILSLTHEQYAAIKLIKETEFTAPYKVYLGIGDVNNLAVTEEGYSSVGLVLHGLSETDSGGIAVKEQRVNVEVFAEDSVLNWDPDALETAKVLDAYWADENLNITNLLSADISNNNIKVVVKTEGAVGKNVKVRIGQTLLSRFKDYEKFVTNDDQTVFDIEEITPDFFGTQTAIGQFYLIVSVGNGSPKSFINNILRVHMVRFIPDVMRAQSPPWILAPILQDLWFNRPSLTNPLESQPVLDVLTTNFIKQYPRTEELLDEVIENKIWKNTASINQLYLEIKTMQLLNDLILPINIGDAVEFGSFERINTTNRKGENTILADKYFLNERLYETSLLGLNEDIDDMFGALANFNIRTSVKGIIEKTSDISFKIIINKAGVYVRDSFDFYDDPESSISQPLGFWSPVDNYVGKNPLNSIYITNSDYRNWRIEHQRGGDFLLFSNIIEIEENHIIEDVLYLEITN